VKNKTSGERFLTDMLKKIDKLPYINERNAFLLLTAMHVAGIIGLSFNESRALFQMLTPFNLIATAAILLHFEKEKNSKYLLFILITFLLGYGVEVIGVKTGVIFGEYTYGKTLGMKVLDVPLTIGINWIVLIYLTRGVAAKLTHSKVLIVLIASTLMVLLDLLIEPVAIRFDFWQWEQGIIPIKNYLGWFFLSCLIQAVGLKIFPLSNNRLYLRLLVLEFVFFAALNILMKAQTI